MPKGWGPKDWFPGGGSAEDRKAALEAVLETRKMLRQEGAHYRGELPLGQTWALTFGHSRDSDLLEESNWDGVTGDLERRFPNDVEVVRFGHFAVGWVEELAVRMLDEKGKPTKAGIAALEFQKQLEDYPVLDEEDLSNREYDETVENIKSEGGLTDEEAGKVYQWLWDNNQRAVESRDGRGGYPSDEEIKEALLDLGLREPEEDEDAEELPLPPEPIYNDPAQTWIWPETRL